MSNITETPTGFVIGAPWPSVDRAMLIELKCYMTSIKSRRNVLSVKAAARSKDNSVTDQSFTLAVASDATAPNQYEYDAKPNNVACVVYSNRPVNVTLTTVNGELDLGLITVFMISSPIQKIKFVNSENKGDAEINLLVV